MPQDPLYELSYPWLPAADHVAVCCPICGQADRERVISRFSLNGEPFSIRECVRDNLMFLSPQPGDHFCKALYNHPSYHAGTDDMYGVASGDEKARAIATMRIEELLPFVNRRGSFLEYGCARGHLLEAAQSAGFVRVTGIEYAMDALRHCRIKKLDVWQGILGNPFGALDRNDRYDVVALYSVLEHLRNPVAFLEKIPAFLADGGILIVRVPDTPPEGPRLSLLDHFWHFNQAALSTLLATQGYSIRAVFPSGTYKGIQHVGEVRSITLIANAPDSI